MKLKPFIHGSIILGILVTLSACEYDTSIPNPSHYAEVYMPQAVDNPVEFSYSDSTKVIIYGANFGGPGYPKDEIEVMFEVNNAYVDSFNMRNNSNYFPLAKKSYMLQQTSAVIPKGKVSTIPLELRLEKTAGIDTLRQYLLPLQIVKVNGCKVNEDLAITYFVISF